MDSFLITGGRPLRGSVRINGAKNACLPLMACALLTDKPVTLTNVPNLADIRNMQRLLDSLGCSLSHAKPEAAERSDKAPDQAGSSPDALTIHAADHSKVVAHYDIVRTMRAGICVLGPLLASRGKARVSMPGGCAIGARPVDLHLRGLEALGATITLDAGYIVAEAPKGGRLKGAHIFLGGPNGSTALGTANVMSAATLAQGTTVIECAACEPEIVDVGNLLLAMGAKITGLGSPRITIEGVDALHGTPNAHPVIPDRIEAGTYLMAAAITHGDVTLENFPTDDLGAALDRLHEIGVTIDRVSPDGSTSEIRNQKSEIVRVAVARRLNPVQVVTQPHPGFPTDLQAQIMALLTLADGNAIITEKIFPDRFLHVAELQRMGANITRVGPSAMITGVRELVGAPVMASDLRASAGLVIAALAARGQTQVNRVYHLDRGYEQMEVTLQGLGAEIERVKE
ncbi:UDP-N-acetylglucosamine 1-carboxyvinyltransferase [Algisphaera agarilytica]|uniref:UDP-N-acetylglucosamine 1-carboxyvinyltransferase n=1 Tax=Algisphaera agarilytica TaxID=1385975 RepID=A0A7X0LLG9_9BACT|nr:UDP-N-acetylglucosamine 1-carboxyvinyltransferase [Algisphaera agarilytica]MBB6429963.1 UDP-N-acetylglucosamine 1-carboxyvinyltransferase [Algisphaera agarilytica]